MFYFFAVFNANSGRCKSYPPITSYLPLSQTKPILLINFSDGFQAGGEEKEEAEGCCSPFRLAFAVLEY